MVFESGLSCFSKLVDRAFHVSRIHNKREHREAAGGPAAAVAYRCLVAL